jgi:hypothetical protein
MTLRANNLQLDVKRASTTQQDEASTAALSGAAFRRIAEPKE